jgi:subtilisin family serine protease
MSADLAGIGARTRIKVATALAAVLALGTFHGAASGTMTPALQEHLGALPADASVDVVALMQHQVDGGRFADRPAALMRALRRAATRTQADVSEEIEGPVQRFWLVNAIAFSGTPDEVRAVAGHPSVAEVDLDREVRVDGADITGAPFPNAPEGNWGLAGTSVPTAWNAFGVRGDGVRVGSIDTGINPGHPDLAGKVVAWRDFVAGQPAPYDDNGHGTHTAGTIAGGDAGGGPIGVAPGARLVVAKAMGANGSGPGTALLAAAEWMTDPDGDPATPDHPAVINNSWSASAANDLWFRPMIRRWRELGIVPVFSAGNTGPGQQTVGSPAGYPEAIAVGALDRGSMAAPFSSQGPVVWHNLDGQGPAAGTVIAKPDVSAPGVAIVSSVGNGYLAYSGTSMASPHVAGIVALLRQANPGLGPDEIAHILRASAVDVGAPGPDMATGAGRVDANRAVAMALGTAPAAPGAGATPAPGGPAASSAAGPAVAFVGTPGPLTSAVVARFRIRFTGGAELVRVRVNGGAWGPAGFDPGFAVRLPEGRHVVEAQGLDAEGRPGAGAPAAHAVTVDRTPPAVRVTWHRAGGRLVFTATTRDRHGVRPGSVRWDFGHGDVARGSTVVRRFADDAPRRVLVSATDRAGNARHVVRRLRPPRAGTPVSRLRVRNAVRGGRGAVTVTGTSRITGRLLVRVRPLRATAPAGTQRASDRVLVAGRTVAARASAARRGSFALSVPVRHLDAGLYRVEFRAGPARSIRTIRVR